MAKASCPNGHGMWDGDGTPTVWAYRVQYFYDYMRDNPNCVLSFGDHLWQIYDCVDGVPGEELDCWYCDECRGLVVFVDTFRYDYGRMEKTPDIKLSDVNTWDEYIALRDKEFEKFTDFYEGKSPVWAIENYPFQYKYRVSPDKTTIYAFDAAGHIQFGYQQVHFTDYGSSSLNHELRDTRYPYSSSEDSNDTKHEEELKPLFEGQLKKLQLTSNRICYGPCPEPDDEVEQHLTITANGRVWFSRYCFGENGKYRLLQKDTFTISSEAARRIMDECAECFSKINLTEYFTDVGSWNATLTNKDGQVFRISSSLGFDLKTANNSLSNIIRKNLGRDDLYVFDGNPDTITRLEVLYHRITKIKPKVYPENLQYDHVNWNYSEHLVIDSNTESIEYCRQIGSGCEVTSNYYIDEGVSTLLERLNENAFSNIHGNPPDVIDDPLETKDYKIIISTKHKENQTITGTFDKNGLPTCWPDVIKEIYDFMSFYGIGEIFDKRIFGKAKRRESDLIFCNVVFDDRGRTYCYIADSDDYSEGDLVVVPTGRENREAVVRIESIEYHPAEEAPYPLKQIKHILRKYIEAEK